MLHICYCIRSISPSVIAEKYWAQSLNKQTKLLRPSYYYQDMKFTYVFETALSEAIMDLDNVLQ